MSISPQPLGYCTNVHPARTLAELLGTLADFSSAIRRRHGGAIGVGLWLCNAVTEEVLADAEGPGRLAAACAKHQLCCYTLNAFPFGDFHDAMVKHRVYAPGWDQPSRLRYTLRCAEILARLLPAGGEGSISTLPVGPANMLREGERVAAAMERLIDCAAGLARLEDSSGRTVRLAIEPEPMCVLETTGQTTAFFERLRERARRRGELAAVQRHVGVCFDVCHQAVEFEAIGHSIANLDRAGVRINKVQLSSAIRVELPMMNAAGRAALRGYVEPRYLHQTAGLLDGGAICWRADLDAALVDDPPADFAAAREWRVHFHVPIDRETLGPLQTTHAQLREAIEAIGALPYGPDLEVETYTWEVLSGGQRVDIVEGIARELAAGERLIGRAG